MRSRDGREQHVSVFDVCTVPERSMRHRHTTGYGVHLCVHACSN